MDAWVLDVLPRANGSFAELVTLLPGVYPAEVVASLQRVDEGNLESSVSSELIAAASSPPARLGDLDREPYRKVLPAPHPLDYDWRFAEEAIQLMSGEVSRNTSPGGLVATIGAPSMFLRLAELGLFDLRGFEACDTTIRRLQRCKFNNVTVHRSGNRALPAGNADTVVIDPPWYVAYFEAFLRDAARLLGDAGTLLMSLPPSGTRPGIIEENEQVVEFAKELGLRLEERMEGVLPYLTPPFERVSLRACGITNIRNIWRRGDLVRFSKSVAAPRAHAFRAPPDQWQEHSTRNVRIKTRKVGKDGGGGDLLTSLVPGDVLPSVSRRDGRRRRVRAWTSCNRVFGSDNVVGLREVLDLICSGSKTGDRSSKEAMRDLDRLIDIEAEELSAFR